MRTRCGSPADAWLPYLAEIKKPQFLMVGEYDVTCGKYEQELFVRSAQNGKLEILKNCAHLTWFEYPEKYTEMIRQAVKWSGKKD